MMSHIYFFSFSRISADIYVGNLDVLVHIYGILDALGLNTKNIMIVHAVETQVSFHVVVKYYSTTFRGFQRSLGQNPYPSTQINMYCFSPCNSKVLLYYTIPLTPKQTFLAEKNYFFKKIFKNTLNHHRNVIFLLLCKKNPALFYAKNRTKISLKLPISQCFTFRTF